jgi:predicted DNA binding CopG/RHH family protein
MNPEKEEQELIRSVESDEWKERPDFSDIKKKLEMAAHATAQKDYRMNIRISKRDVELLKSKAMEEGVPYQTLVSSILHKYVTGRLKERPESGK